MKSTILLLAFFFNFSSSFSQQKKDLTLSAAYGKLNSPDFEKAKAGELYEIDFAYHLSNRSVLAANYFGGKHRYYDDIRSNDPLSFYYNDGTNSTADYKTFSLLYKYKLLNTKRWNIMPGVGAGFMTLKRSYPYRNGNSYFTAESSFTDLAFPVKLETNYKLTSRFHVGLRGGFLVEPDFPVLAWHGGFALSYVVR